MARFLGAAALVAALFAGGADAQPSGGIAIAGDAHLAEVVAGLGPTDVLHARLYMDG